MKGKRGPDSLYHKDFTIICGHYGCGKTNLSINLAIDAAAEGRKVTLVDFDIVNPYFRSSDYVDLLNGMGVKVIAPSYARSTIDLPMISPGIYSVLEDEGVVIVDAGGDDAGVTVLGSFSDKLHTIDYDMLYVINRYRALSTTVEESVKLMEDIERASHMKATAIVNNSHLMQDSTPQTIIGSLAFADAVSLATGLPVRSTVVPRFLAGSVGGVFSGSNRERDEGGGIGATDMYVVDIYVHPPWMDEVRGQ